MRDRKLLLMAVCVLNNLSLANLAGLASVQVVASDVVIQDNDSLLSSDLPGLQIVGGGVQVRQCQVLPTVSGFASLASVGEYFHVSENPAMTAISAAPSLVSVGGNLTIRDNPGLSTLSGLVSVATVGLDFTVRDNPLLPTCQAQALLAPIMVAGATTVQNNLADACGN